MAVNNLHEAALVLENLYTVVEELFDQTAPMQMAYFDERVTLHPQTDEQHRALWQRTGYQAFFDAAAALLELLQSVEEVDCADTRRRWEEAGRPGP